MQELSSSQQDILFRLKTRGPQSARSLAVMLDMTPVGARQHLMALHSAGMVRQSTSPEQPSGRGRPLRRWELTQKGHGHFPDAHADMTVALITSVREVFGEAGLDALIQSREQERLSYYREALMGANSAVQRLQKLRELRSAEGYMSEIKTLGADSWLFIENHCPICAAATACQGFCRSELEVFQHLLQGVARIERINHILSGARRCAYRVSAVANEVTEDLAAGNMEGAV